MKTKHVRLFESLWIKSAPIWNEIAKKHPALNYARIRESLCDLFLQRLAALFRGEEIYFTSYGPRHAIYRFSMVRDDIEIVIKSDGSEGSVV